MDAWMYAAALLYAASLAVVVRVARRARHWYPLAKGIQSGLFVLIGAAAWWTGARREPEVFSLLFGALVLCALGDVLIGLANRTHQVRARPFLLGSCCFLAAHLFFCASFAADVPLSPLDLLPAAAAAALVRWQERRGRIRLKKTRLLGYLYAFVVGYMCTRAIRCGLYAGYGPSYTALTCLGAALFLFSDWVLLYLYFGTWRPRWLRTANLVSYYAGILLLALGAHWL